MNTLGLGRYVNTLGLGTPYQVVVTIITRPITYPGGGGSQYEPVRERKMRVRQVVLPGDEIDYRKIEQLIREDEELLTLIVAAIQTGVIP